MAKKKAKPPKKNHLPGRASADSPDEGKLQRLNKVLAAAGFGSRREVEELIVQGRVEVDREIVTKLACKVDPRQVQIKVDGQLVKQFRPVYFVLNKPKGVLSTNKDPSGRIRVVDFVPDNQRVFSVGRLDKSSEGLMLLTNDGELAQKLAHPKYRVQKTYSVVVAGVMSKEELAKLRKGVYLSEGFARIDGATIRAQRKASTELEIVLSEGKNREIRRILARAGHKVLVLKRIAIGPLRLGQLPVGAARELTSSEIKALKNYSPEATRTKRKSRKPKAQGQQDIDRQGSQRSKKAADESPELKPLATDKPSQSNWDDDDFSDVFEAIQQDTFQEADDFGETFDDDFVSGSAGSVLAYDDESSPETKRAGRPRRRSGASRSTTGKKTGSSNTSSSRRAKSKGKRAATSNSSSSINRKKASGSRTSTSRKSSPKGPGRTSSSSKANAKKRSSRSGKTTRGKRGRG